MTFPKPRISGPGIAAAFGAGLAAALFLMLPAQKMAAGLGPNGALPATTAVALLMGFLAPLPLMIAAIGFGPFAGLIALVVGAATVAAIGLLPLGGVIANTETVSYLDVLVFVVSFGIPSWMLARIGATPLPVAPDPVPGKARPEERILGLIVTVAVAFGILSASLSLAANVSANGTLDGFIDSVAKQVGTLIADKPDLPKGADPHKLAQGIIQVAIPLIAAAQAVVLLANLWLAARIAQMSNLLPVPWPDVPRHLRVPRLLAPIFAVALGLSFAGGLVGIAGLIVSAGLGAALVLQGLAVMHTITRGKTYRTPALIIVYLVMPWLLAFYGLIGLLDTAFAFRDRPKKPKAPPGPWTPPPSRTP